MTVACRVLGCCALSGLLRNCVQVPRALPSLFYTSLPRSWYIGWSDEPMDGLNVAKRVKEDSDGGSLGVGRDEDGGS